MAQRRPRLRPHPARRRVGQVVVSCRYDLWSRFTGDALTTARTRYWRTVAGLHRDFDSVLTHLYNELHHSHVHLDDGRVGSGGSQFRTRSRAQVQAVQGMLTWVWDEPVDTSGQWDDATRAATGRSSPGRARRRAHRRPAGLARLPRRDAAARLSDAVRTVGGTTGGRSHRPTPGRSAGPSAYSGHGRLQQTDGLTDEQTELLALVRQFVDEQIIPVATALEHADEYPEKIVEAMKEMGIFGLMIPEEYGGLGESLLTYALVVEEIARGWMSVSGIINTHFIVAYMLLQHGTEEQKQHYLPRMATGEVRGAFSMSEPGAAPTSRASGPRRCATVSPTTGRSTARRCG